MGTERGHDTHGTRPVRTKRGLRRAYYQVGRYGGMSRRRAWWGAWRLVRKDWKRRPREPQWPDDYSTAGLHGTGWM